ncbi:metal-sensing transcriptional repressor [Aliisedimentitalea scapharcae]|uniref:Metal-sensing transcriptional repressor n=1 Tax=Aliisedimentitalea scapharcae TaxID=1524259 RepID=A0ABZ2XSL3_9RHOB|nr:metal-sensing transcriptional repressor [Rhodobacteraceae bacterium M382]
MTRPHKHQSHPKVIARLKRANGHLAHVIAMIEEGSPCTDIAQQLQAVEKAITNAKRVLIHDHIDHCLDPDEAGHAPDTASFKAITRYL